MRLRARLAVSAAVALVPSLAALVAYDVTARHRAAEERLVGYVTATMSAERGRCEDNPVSWGGDVFARRGPPPGPPPPGLPPPKGPPPNGPSHAPAKLFAYDAALQSRNPDAPDPRGRVGVWRQLLGADVVEIVVPMPWLTGPCAVILARGTTDPAWGAVLPDSPLWTLPLALVVGAVLVSMGPAVRRLRRLTDDVRRSAGDGYRTSVGDASGDEIGELSRAFDAAGAEIRARLDEKERRETALRAFLANTTHDVAIPLTVLQGHLATLRDGAEIGRPLDAATLASAMQEAHYIGSLLHDLAAIARLDLAEQTLVRHPVDLGALVARVLSRHRPIARERGVAIEAAVPDEPITIAADVTLVEQAVSNVVFNAVRYNRAGGHVAIVLETPTSVTFSIRVSDDGPGISPDEMARIVTRGARGAFARTRAPEGQGLGLHIAFRSAALHGFTLELRPGDEGGLDVLLSGERSVRSA